MNVDVAGQLWKLDFYDDNSRIDSSMGRSDSKMGVIHISKSINNDVKKVTLIHEWLHGILDVYGVDHTESVVNVLANELFRIGFVIKELDE
jgi:hypothetical protein